MPRVKKVVKKKRPVRKVATKTKKRVRTVAPKKPAKNAKKRLPSMGRVKVPVDARLDLVFQKDYQAREIFAFLKIETVRELEQFGPDQIIERLAGPVFQTVQRIRKMLALANRHLAKDEKFAKAFLSEVKQAR
jgi:hypothetical protein